MPADTADAKYNGGEYWSNLANVAWPEKLIWDEFGTRFDTSLGGDISFANDDQSITDTTRKKKLKPLFRKLGYRIKYVKGAP